MSEILPTRFGLKFDPPTIILEYESVASKKLYLHIMPVNELEPSHDPQDWLEILKKEHSGYLNSKLIEESQLLGLIQRLQDGLLGESSEEKNYEDWAF